MKRHLHFVINPLAGHGRALAYWNRLHGQIENIARKKGIPILLTHSFAGEEFAFEFQSVELERVLVSVGGDGSVHWSAQQAIRMGVPLAVVPAGTGNDYANNLGIPSDMESVMDMLLLGKPGPVDVIRINQDIALNLAGFGLDADVIHWLDAHSGLKWMGRTGYGVVVPIALWKHKPFHARIHIMDEDHSTQVILKDVSILAVANGARFGGGMNIAPGANPRDGQLDLIVASGLSKMALLRFFPRVYNGSHISHPAVKRFIAKRIRIDFLSNAVAAEYDGECYFPSTTVEVGLGPKLHVILPVEGPRNRNSFRTRTLPSLFSS